MKSAEEWMLTVSWCDAPNAENDVRAIQVDALRHAATIAKVQIGDYYPIVENYRFANLASALNQEADRIEKDAS